MNRSTACAFLINLGFFGFVRIAYISCSTDGIFAIGFAVAVVIDFVVTDFRLAIVIIGARSIVAVINAVAIVIDTVITDFRFARYVIGTSRIVAIYLVVAIVIDLVVTDFDAIGVITADVAAITC